MKRVWILPQSFTNGPLLERKANPQIPLMNNKHNLNNNKHKRNNKQATHIQISEKVRKINEKKIVMTPHPTRAPRRMSEANEDLRKQTRITPKINQRIQPNKYLYNQPSKNKLRLNSKISNPLNNLNHNNNHHNNPPICQQQHQQLHPKMQWITPQKRVSCLFLHFCFF